MSKLLHPHELEELRAYREASKTVFSIQEQSMVALSARVDELRAEVAELRAENARLRAQLEARGC